MFHERSSHPLSDEDLVPHCWVRRGCWDVQTTGKAEIEESVSTVKKKSAYTKVKL